MDARILVAEDSAANREVAQAMIESLGHSCDLVEDGVRAVEAVSTERYDLVLMDCQMPRLDGYSATRAIRDRERPLRRPRALSGAIVSAILAMDRELGLRVVAEGVESAEQLEFLRRTACDEVQGFLVGRPMTAARLVERLIGERRAA